MSRTPPETANGRHAGNYSDLIDDLRELLTALRELLAGKKIDYKIARSLSDYVTETRVLLSKLSGEGNQGAVDRDTAHFFEALKKSFFELEGMVKELRNRLERSGAQG